MPHYWSPQGWGTPRDRGHVPPPRVISGTSGWTPGQDRGFIFPVGIVSLENFQDKKHPAWCDCTESGSLKHHFLLLPQPTSRALASVASPPGLTLLCSSVPLGLWLLCSGATEVPHSRQKRLPRRGHRLPSFPCSSSGLCLPASVWGSGFRLLGWVVMQMPPGACPPEATEKLNIFFSSLRCLGGRQVPQPLLALVCP